MLLEYLKGVTPSGRTYRYTLMNCEICGEEAIKKKGIRHENKRTCGKHECTTKLALLNKDNFFSLRCVICDSEFKNPRKNAKYCSEACRSKRYENDCEQCGCKYRTKRKHSYLCSKECKVKYLKNNLRTATCTECGIEFTRSASHIRTSGNVFCSRSCNNRYFAYKNYGEDSKYGKEWYHTRKEVIQFYGSKCQKCDAETDKIAVHHTVPYKYIETKSQINNFEILIPLCYECHSDVHTKNDKWFKESFGGKKI